MAGSAPTLSSAQIKSLKAQAHHLSPVVMMGAAGLTDAIIKEVSMALDAHGLIKVSLTGEDRDDRKAIMARICDALFCAPVQLIGKQAVLFREKPEKDNKDEPHIPKKQAAQGVKKAGRNATLTSKNKPAGAKKKKGDNRSSGKAKARAGRKTKETKSMVGEKRNKRSVAGGAGGRPGRKSSRK